MHDEPLRELERGGSTLHLLRRDTATFDLLGILYRDASGRVTDANDRFLELLGASREAVEEGRLHWDDISAPGELVRMDGARLPVVVGSAPLADDSGSLVFVVDRSERASLEARIRRAEKLESIGVMAGGIAHDFNSLLTSILCNADLALTSLPEDSQARLAVQRIEVTARRAAALTRQMLEVASHGRRPRQRVDLSRLVEDTLPMVEPLLPATAAVLLRLDPGLPLIEADASQLGQVVMNLLSNAADALEGAVGSIEVVTGASDEPTSDAPCVWLEVTDSGVGMDPRTRARIFEPFFSTKVSGRGLGLAAVQAIVRAHGGALDVRSEPSLGTSFRVWFPRERTRAGDDA
jgi:signal transduction histidine kinase